MIDLKPGCKVRLQTHILTADNIEEVQINPTYFNWNWNASQIFPAMEPHQFSQAMQALQDFGLHIVDAADIAHHLKFVNFTDPTPQDISDLFKNPLHYVTMIIVFIMICTVLYIIYTRCIKGKSVNQTLRIMLPERFAPSAPQEQYVHNGPEGHNIHMPGVNMR
jgi:hypothetical protein